MDLWATLTDRSISGELVVWKEGSPVKRPRAALIDDAERAAAALRHVGVCPGERVACVLTNSAEACAGAVGVWLAGGVLISLPVPARATRLDEYRAQIGSLCRAAGSRVLLVEDRFASWLEVEGIDVRPYETLTADRAAEPSPPGPDAPAFVQFSSGSTSAPRGCVLTTRAITAQLEMLGAALRLDPERDRGAMWLPLSHDMGFFGGLMLLWAHGVSGLLSAPERFLAAPETWLADCAEIDATITAAPAFALDLAVRRRDRLRLARPVPLRACLLGGELILPEVLERAARELAPVGVAAATLVPAYGLAEATLAVTISEPGRGPRIDRHAGDDGDERDVVSVGSPIGEVEVRIDGEADGEICVRSPSLASGYLDDPAATARSFRDGELRTGDLGYRRDGELYVLGRADDVLKIGARKLWATEVERSVEGLAGVRPGGTALIALPDGDRMKHVVLLEPAAGDGNVDPLAREIARRALTEFGVRLDEIVVLEPGELPKTPSGKIQRHRCATVARNGDHPRIRPAARS
ncbi:MAG TPA: AMP-binding protein [Actinomycetota bacterium]|nr:AMP-binding protein [Actinomycetota bacterium]